MQTRVTHHQLIIHCHLLSTSILYEGHHTVSMGIPEVFFALCMYILAVHRHSTGSSINLIMTRYAGMTLSMLHSNYIIT